MLKVAELVYAHQCGGEDVNVLQSVMSVLCDPELALFLDVGRKKLPHLHPSSVAALVGKRRLHPLNLSFSLFFC